jgi:transposase
MARKRRWFSDEFRLEAVKLILGQGVSVAQAARDLGVSENVLHSWKKKFEQDPEAFGGSRRLTPEQEEIRKLRKEIQRLRLERDILKKAAAYFAREPQ